MQNNLEMYEKIHTKIAEAKSIAILGHKDPDWDAIGSCSALFQIINLNFSNKKIDLINFTKVPERLYSVPYWDIFIDKLDKKKYDLFIIIDTWAKKLLWFFDDNDNFLQNSNSILIDHHLSNDKYCNLNLVDSTKWAAALIIYDFAKKMNYKINENIAKAIIYWIYTDTWSLSFSSVNSKTFLEVWELIRYIENSWDICNSIFFNNKKHYIKVIWIAFSRFKIINNVWISYIKKEDLEKIWATLQEDSWISGYLNSIDWIDYVMFFYERDWIVKCSLRTPRNDFDLTQIASKYWWWWHKKAAGFSVKWEIKIDNDCLYFWEHKIEY